jgi:HEAT repeat protein
MLAGAVLHERRCAAFALGILYQHDPEAVAAGVPDLARALLSEDPLLRRWASWSFRELGAHAEPALPQLVQALADPEDMTADQAGAGLSKVGPAAIPPLVQLLGSEDPALRRRALGVLGEMKGVAAPAAAALVARVADEDDDVRRAARGAVASVGSATLPALATMIRARRPGWTEAIGCLSRKSSPVAPAAEPLLTDILDSSEPLSEPWTKAAQVLSYKQPFPKAKPLLADLLNHPDPLVRGRAVRRLKGHGRTARPILPLLRARLEDDDPRVRCWAAVAVAAVDPRQVGDMTWLVLGQSLPADHRGTQQFALRDLARMSAPGPSPWWVVPAYYRGELLALLAACAVWFGLATRFPRREPQHRTAQLLLLFAVGVPPAALWAAAVAHASSAYWSKEILAQANLTLIPFPYAAGLSMGVVIVLATVWALRRDPPDDAADPGPGPLLAGEGQAVDLGGGVAGAEAVVDVDHGQAGGAGAEHAHEGGEAAHAGAVADRSGHGDHGPVDQAGDHAGEGALHAGGDDDHAGGAELVGVPEEAVEPGDADVGEELDLAAEDLGGDDGLLGDR